ncbi:MAG: S-methyl-5-thioribose-1-phosphate isomerase [Roseiflexaceae bacterium]
MSAIDTLQHIWWDDGTLCLLDQRRLPAEELIVRCHTLDDVINAIKTMQVRGAPAIGCTAAYGMALVARQNTRSDSSYPAATEALDRLDQAKQRLDAARPTAVNLAWATARILNVARRFVDENTIPATAGPTTHELANRVLDEAHAILAEDLAMCHAMGRHGAGLIPTLGRVLTHCNAGGLATAGYGTALAPIRTAHEQGRLIHVYVDETRPFLQGARLTAWELQRAGVPLTLITDNMAGYFMRRGEIDCVIVGADRVVANGDIANKIGTYSLAVLAKAHDIPFYVAAPSSTVDFALPSGDAIPIEQRDPSEVTTFNGQQIAPAGVAAAHPAFDVTPHELITAIITERGVVYPPYEENLRRTLTSSEF